MRPTIFLSILLTGVFAAASQAAPSADANRFDGTWDTIVSCASSSGAQGFSNKFSSVVKYSSLHGEKGTKGKPGWLQIDGVIKPDGAARLYADRLVGAAEFAVGGRPAGTEYGYHIDAHFQDKEGTGKRVEGRPCDVTFTRVR